MMEDFWIWKSNICRYEGINLNVVNEFLDISEERGAGPKFCLGMFKFGNESHRDTQRLLNTLSLTESY
jgi:hypothetical protein